MNQSPDELLAEPIRRSLWRMGWESLRPLQMQAIQAVLGGSGDLVLAARTAAGKTEAAFLPILSSICDQPLGSIRALYVGPLKALINDQFRRLEELCEYAEIPVHRWHGDVTGDKKRHLVERPGGVLLITPESLESLFINRSAALARLFYSLSFVVIDELHALLGKERGTQLRSQLFRLDRHTVSTPRLVALSATIGDLEAAKRWLRPDDPQLVQVLRDDSGDKSIRYRIHAYTKVSVPTKDSPDKEWVSPAQLFQDIYENYRGSKNLIFANSKGMVEDLTDRLNELGRQNSTGEEFLIHHGSLSKNVREDTERLMQGERPFTTVCSSTLELGVDIGNVRAIGQIDPCWSVSSLVQRLGRSGRRDGEAHQMRIFIIETPPAPADELEQRIYPDLLQAIALTELMLDKWVESPNTCPFDLSTLVQQTLSLIAETGGVTAAALFDRLVARGAFRFLNQRQFIVFIRGLAKHDLIEQQPEGPLILGLVGEEIVSHYDFYAAFISPPEFRVIHDGRVIGRLSAVRVPPLGDHIILGGRRWQVAEVDYDREELLVKPARGRKPPNFDGNDGNIAREIRQKMRLVIRQDNVPSYIDENARKLLADARREAKTAGLNVSDIIPSGQNRLLWFPWTGTREMRTLALLFQWAGLSVEQRSKGLAFEFSGETNEIIAAIQQLVTSPPSTLDLVRTVECRGSRKWDHYVAPELLIESSAADNHDLPSSLACLADLLTQFGSP